jgi:hypothetical protein
MVDLKFTVKNSILNLVEQLPKSVMVHFQELHFGHGLSVFEAHERFFDDIHLVLTYVLDCLQLSGIGLVSLLVDMLKQVRKVDRSTRDRYQSFLRSSFASVGPILSWNKFLWLHNSLE